MSEHKKQGLLLSGSLIFVARVAKFTPDSPEYLSLLVRKAKLPVIKIFRDWLTIKCAILANLEEQSSNYQDFVGMPQSSLERAAV